MIQVSPGYIGHGVSDLSYIFQKDITTLLLFSRVSRILLKRE